MASAAHHSLADDAHCIAGARASKASSSKLQSSRSAQASVSKQLSSSQLAGKNAVPHRRRYAD